MVQCSAGNHAHVADSGVCCSAGNNTAESACNDAVSVVHCFSGNADGHAADSAGKVLAVVHFFAGKDAVPAECSVGYDVAAAAVSSVDLFVGDVGALVIVD